jgi:riboflavin synthase
MFTGIVEEVGSVVSARGGILVVRAKTVLEGCRRGDSIAVNGVCLTVTDMTETSFSVDVMPETESRSNIDLLKTGDRVNLERAVALGGRMGGHIVQGHIDATGTILSMRQQGKAMLVKVNAPPAVMRYVVEKGFIGMDGMSLTVVEKDASSFTVSIVGFTRENTTLTGKKSGDVVNLEADIIAKYVEQLAQVTKTGITPEFLAANGF